MTDGARTVAHRVVVVDDDRVDGAQLQIDGEAEADGPGADDNDRMMSGGSRVLVGMAHIGEDGLAIGAGHDLAVTSSIRLPSSAAHPSRDSHSSLSRCAVQIRGSGKRVASS